MTKFEHQSPRRSIPCKFFLSDGRELTGYYDDGGVRDRPSVIIYEKGESNITESNFSLISGWEYLNATT